MKKILVVEDAPSLRKDMIEALSFEGYSVDGAENGIIALQKVHTFVPDLILCDIMMPEMDGYGVLEHIRNDPVTTAIPLIIVSARKDPLDIRVGMELGADDYITKPFNLEQLLASIRARLRRHDQISGIPTPKQSKKILYHVFLSYSRTDKLVMERVKNLLSNEYLKVWTDENLKPGTPVWKEAIETSIRYSGCMVVILSPDAKKSKWVNREIDFAEMCEVEMFPLLLRGEPNETIPIALASCQWVDIRKTLEPEMKRLANAIKEHVGIATQ